MKQISVMTRPQIRMKYRDRQALVSGIHYYLTKTTYQPERLGYMREIIENNLELIVEHYSSFTRTIQKYFGSTTVHNIHLVVFTLAIERLKQ